MSGRISNNRISPTRIVGHGGHEVVEIIDQRNSIGHNGHGSLDRHQPQGRFTHSNVVGGSPHRGSPSRHVGGENISRIRDHSNASTNFRRNGSVGRLVHDIGPSHGVKTIA